MRTTMSAAATCGLENTPPRLVSLPLQVSARVTPLVSASETSAWESRETPKRAASTPA